MLRDPGATHQPDAVRFGNASACRVCARGGSGRVIMVKIPFTTRDDFPETKQVLTVDEIWNLRYKSRICKNKPVITDELQHL